MDIVLVSLLLTLSRSLPNGKIQYLLVVFIVAATSQFGITYEKRAPPQLLLLLLSPKSFNSEIKIFT